MNVAAGIMHDEESYRNGIPVTGTFLSPTSYRTLLHIPSSWFFVMHRENAPRYQARLRPIYCDSDMYIVVIVECLTRIIGQDA